MHVDLNAAGAALAENWLAILVIVFTLAWGLGWGPSEGEGETSEEQDARAW